MFNELGRNVLLQTIDLIIYHQKKKLFIFLYIGIEKFELFYHRLCPTHIYFFHLLIEWNCQWPVFQIMAYILRGYPNEQQKEKENWTELIGEIYFNHISQIMVNLHEEIIDYMLLSCMFGTKIYHHFIIFLN